MAADSGSTGKKSSTPGVLHDGETRELTEALKAEDRKRRVEDVKKQFGEQSRQGRSER